MTGGETVGIDLRSADNLLVTGSRRGVRCFSDNCSYLLPKSVVVLLNSIATFTRSVFGAALEFQWNKLGKWPFHGAISATRQIRPVIFGECGVGNVTYSADDPLDFAFPVVAAGGAGGLGLTNTMPGWHD